MLPQSNDPTFPAALKAARTKAGMNRAQLARLSQIHSVMPGRYEEGVVRPTQNSWLALNRALGLCPPASPPAASTTGTGASGVLLTKASTDEIVSELRSRGIGVTLTFPVT